MKKIVALVLMACMMLTFAAAEEIQPPKMIAATIYDAQGVVVENITDDSVAVADEPIAPMDPTALGVDSMSKFETFVVKVADGKLAEGNVLELTVEIDPKLPLPTAIFAAGANGVWSKIAEYTAEEKQITFELTEGGSVALLIAASAQKEVTQTTTTTSTTTTVVYTDDEYASFTPSVSGKPAPVTVPDGSGTTVTVATITTSTETIKVPAGNNLNVVAVSERNYVEDGAKLEKAYQSILNNELKDLLAGMTVRDLFEVTLTGEYEASMAEEGSMLEMTFDADIDATKPFKVLCSSDSETWTEVPAENITINADGSVTLKLEEVGVIAFVVEADEAPAADVTSPV